MSSSPAVRATTLCVAGLSGSVISAPIRISQDPSRSSLSRHVASFTEIASKHFRPPLYLGAGVPLAFPGRYSVPARVALGSPRIHFLSQRTISGLLRHKNSCSRDRLFPRRVASRNSSSVFGLSLLLSSSSPVRKTTGATGLPPHKDVGWRPSTRIAVQFPGTTDLRLPRQPAGQLMKTRTPLWQPPCAKGHAGRVESIRHAKERHLSCPRGRQSKQSFLTLSLLRTQRTFLVVLALSPKQLHAPPANTAPTHGTNPYAAPAATLLGRNSEKNEPSSLTCRSSPTRSSLVLTLRLVHRSATQATGRQNVKTWKNGTYAAP